jgi:putative nucleotidyltransferase with HDIG domain
MKRRRTLLPPWPPTLPGLRRRLRWETVARLLLLVCTTGILTTLIFLHLDLYQIGGALEQIRADQPAPHDIKAPEPVQLYDPVETERQRADAASRAPVVYAPDPRALDNAQQDLAAIFRRFTGQPLTTDDLDALQQLKVSTATAQAMNALPTTLRAHLRDTAAGVLPEVMATRIDEGAGLEDAVARLTTLVNTRVPDPAQAALVRVLTHAALRPTWVRDDAQTRQRQEEARAAVSRAMRTYHSGDVIVRTGERLRPELLDALRAKGLLTPAPATRLLPILGLILFALVSLGVYLRNNVSTVYGSPAKLLLLVCLIIAPLWVYITLGTGNEYLVGLLAIPAGCMAISGLLGIPTAVVATMLLAVTAGLTIAPGYQYASVVLTLGSSLAGVMAISSIWPARRAFPTVLALIGINLVLLVSIEGLRPGGGLLGHLNEQGTLALYALAGTLGATFAAVGAIYILARPFGITTHYRLMELANPNESLLSRMLQEAPGTYHSSMMVANMAEAAADAIGANALLARVGALYHDIGKLKRPAFFVENQAPLGIEENVHQRLAPKLSFLILAGHVRDGVELGQQHRLPDEIVSVIREHHGTTLAAYFYHRARAANPRENVQEHEFRYPGPLPSTREAAVVMLADSVQASVKSLKEPTPTRIAHMVHEILLNRQEDGQFANCDITQRDLARISDVFVRMLSGLYTYTRIEYPEIKKDRETRAHTHSESAKTASAATIAAPRG